MYLSLMATATGYSSSFILSNLIIILLPKFMGITSKEGKKELFISRGWMVDEFDEWISGLMYIFRKLYYSFWILFYFIRKIF